VRVLHGRDSRFALFFPEKNASTDEPHCLAEHDHGEAVHIESELASALFSMLFCGWTTPRHCLWLRWTNCIIDGSGPEPLRPAASGKIITRHDSDEMTATTKRRSPVEKLLV
jgi:hypothetical protein